MAGPLRQWQGQVWAAAGQLGCMRTWQATFVVSLSRGVQERKPNRQSRSLSSSQLLQCCNDPVWQVVVEHVCRVECL